MPELPEVEITARLIGAAIAGAQVESVLTPGINALRTFDPPLSRDRGCDGSPASAAAGKLFVIGIDAASCRCSCT